MIKAKRIYEPTPKKEEQVDLQKVIADAFQSSISKAEKVSTGVSLEIEKENKIIERIMYKIEDKIKAMKIDKSGVTEDVYKQLSSSLNSLGEYLLNIVNNHEHDYLTSEDKDECISIAETMVNEAVDKFDSLIKPFENSFLKVLERKADKEHSHNEFDEIMEEIEENEKELESKIDKKADKKHMHKIGDIENLKDKLEKKADKEHKHDEYATRQELEFIAMQKARGTGGGGHVIQGSGVILAQRSNLNFLGATVTDDPDNNATVVTTTGGGGSGDVVGPASSTDGNIALYDGATGKLIKNSTYSPASFALLSGNTFSGNNIQITGTSNIFNTGYTGSMFYNTADQTTNYERLRINWSANIATISVESAGTSSARVLRLQATSGTGGSNSRLDINRGTGALLNFDFSTASSSTSGSIINLLTSSSSSAISSGSIKFVSIAPTVNHSGTAGYNALAINITETATGSGLKTLFRGQVGGVDKFIVNNDGSIELGNASDTTIRRVSAGVVSIEGVNIVTTSSTDTLTNKTIGGALILDENASLQLDGVLSADGKWSGTTITGTAGYTQAFGDLVTLDKDDSRWEAVDISVAAAATGDARGILGMVVSTGTDGTACTILLQGTIRADANFPALTIGAPVYASTSGDIIVTQPTTTDYVIRIVGYALTADSIYFNPGASWTTHT